MKTHYEVLEIERTSTARQIREAYENAVRLVEKDSVANYLMLDDEGQDDARAQIEQAFAVLGDPARRAAYDAASTTPPKPPKKNGKLRFLRPVEAQPARGDSAKHPAAPRPELQDRPPSAERSKPMLAATGAPSLGEDELVCGAVLKRLREASGLSMDQLAKKTRVHKRYIQALEAEDMNAMPARVYVRGFLTQIARAVGVERARLADGYVKNVLPGASED